jgi:hypothetical protein
MRSFLQNEIFARQSDRMKQKRTQNTLSFMDSEHLSKPVKKTLSWSVALAKRKISVLYKSLNNRFIVCFFVIVVKFQFWCFVRTPLNASFYYFGGSEYI